ncbi:MAG TPA: hypothetical protein VIV11_20545 [Kofleriaceae bacterium]
MTDKPPEDPSGGAGKDDDGSTTEPAKEPATTALDEPEWRTTPFDTPSPSSPSLPAVPRELAPQPDEPEWRSTPFDVATPSSPAIPVLPQDAIDPAPAIEPATEPDEAALAVAPIDTVTDAVAETATPTEAAPVEAAASETAASEATPFVEDAPVEDAPVEAAPIEAAAFETAPLVEPEPLPGLASESIAVQASASVAPEPPIPPPMTRTPMPPAPVIAMIGVKSIAIVMAVVGAAALAIRSGTVSIAHFGELTIASAFATGLFAAASTAILLRSRAKSRAALIVKRPRLVVDLPAAHPGVHELPPIIQRVLVASVFACLGLATFTSDATARIASVPDDLTRPSRAAYCLDDEPKPEHEASDPVAPPPPPVDQAGCALVKRAYQLGYAKTLGSCAPSPAVAAAKPKDETKPEEEACDRRELDEPFLHYTWRRVVETAQGASPIDAAQNRADDISTRIGYLEDLLADVKHSITGTPHASHHIFVSLPDPHPKSSLSEFTGEEPCTALFEDLPLWPVWSADAPKGAIVEHVLGQLLFATRFGSPASCSDYTLHWDAPADACARIAKDARGFLEEHDALEPMRAVLDRRRRQAALHTLMLELEHKSTLPEPPPASHVASVGCFSVGSASSSSGSTIDIDGETLLLRAATTPATTSLDVYTDLARMLAGATTTVRPATSEPLLDDAEFPLASLEPYLAIDPFTIRTALGAAELVEVYPFDRHLHAFVEGFRRVYFAQRGRL